MTRPPIQQLPQSLVNRIAAGEVIERPASVVKELVDNAIDSDASLVIVEVEDGGRELVRVIDDGCGIPPEQLPLAFAPHATSKLTCDDDLFRINTMGFRGEALASIGSVAHARILSRVATNDEAYELRNTGGDTTDPQACAGNVGTTVEIRHLFFNVPARRKFLKGTQTEFGHISDMLMRLAIPHPQIAFKLFHNGRLSREYPTVAPAQRQLIAWPEAYHGQRLPIDTNDVELRIKGIIGLPELASPTAKYQHFYVNRRPVRDKFIQHALREAYRGLTEPGRQPAAVLLIELPPGDVDVNVHPTKSEVRFKDSSRVHGLVMSGVRSLLLGHDLTPRATASPVFFKTPGNAEPDPDRKVLADQLASFFRTPVNPYTPILADTTDARPVWNAAPSSAFTGGRFLPEVAATRITDVAQTSTPNDTNTHETPVPRTFSPASSKAIQVHNSYLVVESEEGMLVIDQHALHERIVYEDLLKKISSGPLESQRMLIPTTLRVSSRQIDLLEQVKPVLLKLGIDADVIGPEAIAINSFPSFLERLEPGAFVQELLEKGEQELLDINHEELLHDVLDMMACKAAVKAGDPLTSLEIDALLARRELVDRSSNCPHGRPTTLRLSIKDLEKQFKRTGF